MFKHKIVACRRKEFRSLAWRLGPWRAILSAAGITFTDDDDGGGAADITYSAVEGRRLQMRSGGCSKEASRLRPLRHVCQNDNGEIRRGGASERGKSDNASFLSQWSRNVVFLDSHTL